MGGRIRQPHTFYADVYSSCLHEFIVTNFIVIFSPLFLGFSWLRHQSIPMFFRLLCCVFCLYIHCIYIANLWCSPCSSFAAWYRRLKYIVVIMALTTHKDDVQDYGFWLFRIGFFCLTSFVWPATNWDNVRWLSTLIGLCWSWTKLSDPHKS